jgi:hypothetical protein
MTHAQGIGLVEATYYTINGHGLRTAFPPRDEVTGEGGGEEFE